MNKRRRFGAKRRRRTAKLKQMWMSGMSPADLFRRINGCPPKSILDLPNRERELAIRNYSPVTGRFATRPQIVARPARDLHQERADREGIPRSLAKIRNYGELFR